MADRQSPTRFDWSMPLLMGGGTDFRDMFRQEFLYHLASNPPRWIVVAPLSELLLGGKFTEQDFPAFADFLDHYYVERTKIVNHVLKERRSDVVLPDARDYCTSPKAAYSQLPLKSVLRSSE